jgi:hypothetical protein
MAQNKDNKNKTTRGSYPPQTNKREIECDIVGGKAHKMKEGFIQLTKKLEKE